MHTKDKLADALTEAGLPEMAAKAREGYYHDFLSPLPLPDLQLLADLRHARLTGDQIKIDELIYRHTGGEFDANLEESEEWARSEDGKRAIRDLY